MNAAATLHLPVVRLFADKDDGFTRERMDHRVPELVSSRLGGVHAAVVGGVQTEIGQLIDDVLGADVADVLASGWRKHRMLREAGRRTLDEPGRQERVELAAHSISFRQQPAIEIRVDEVAVPAIHFDVELVARIAALVGVVDGGRLTSIEAGEVDLSGSLSCEGVELAHGRLDPPIDLHGVVSLGDGIRLVED
jgi:hypothetical protein